MHHSLKKTYELNDYLKKQESAAFEDVAQLISISALQD